MKNTIAIAAVAGLATFATAQSLTVEPSETSVMSGSTISVNVVLDTGGIDIEGYDLVVTTTAGTISNVSQFFVTGTLTTNQLSNTDTTITADAADSFGSVDEPDFGDGVALLTFDLTFDAGFVGTADISVTNGTISLTGAQGFPLFQNEIIAGFPSPVGVAAEYNNASVNVFIPTPGAAAVLGLGGLVAARRRR